MLTHYFSRPPVLDPARFETFVMDVRRLLAALPSDITIMGCDGTGEPEINAAIIAFNGDAAQQLDHESFIMQQTYTLRPPSRMMGGMFHDFCKTAGKPYDLLVVAVLYAFVHRFPECEFATDATANPKFCQFRVDFLR